MMMSLASCAKRAAPPTWRSEPLAELQLPALAPHMLLTEVAQYRVTVAGMALAQFEYAQTLQHGWLAISGLTKPDGMGGLFSQLRSEFMSSLRIVAGRGVPAEFRAQEVTGLATPQQELVVVTYNEAGAWVEVSRPPAAPLAAQQMLTRAQPFDLGTFLFAIRWLELPTGGQVAADVFRGEYAWRAQLTAAGAEIVHTDLGNFRARRFDGRSRRLDRQGQLAPSPVERTYSLWISDDADRVLLKLRGESDLGAVEMELVNYVQNGRGGGMSGS